MPTVSPSSRTHYAIGGTIRKDPATGIWYPVGATGFGGADTHGYRGIGTITESGMGLNIQITSGAVSDLCGWGSAQPDGVLAKQGIWFGISAQGGEINLTAWRHRLETEYDEDPENPHLLGVILSVEQVPFSDPVFSIVGSNIWIDWNNWKLT